MPGFSWKEWWNNAVASFRFKKPNATLERGDSFEQPSNPHHNVMEQPVHPTSKLGRGDATPLQAFRATPLAHGKLASGHLNTEEFCAELKKEALDIDECVFEAASWQQQRKVADWIEDVVDDLKQTGLVRKPGLFEYTWFTVSTAGAVAGWIAGGPVGSVIGSKTASLAVGVGFGIKELADKYTVKVNEAGEPVSIYELSSQPGVDPLLLPASHDSKAAMCISKFEMEQGNKDLLGTTMYTALA